MKKIIFFFIVILIPGICVLGQPVSFDTAGIPKSVKEGADVVKRYEQVKFDVTDIDKAKYSVHQVYTILNKEGNSSLFFSHYTNRYINLEELDIRLFDAAGKQINRYKKKDLTKYANTDGLVDDGIYYFLNLASASYPVTVEYKYEVNFTGTLNYPTYDISGEDEGVEESTCIVKVPAELGLRFREQQIKLQPVTSDEGQYKIYKWSVKNLSPVKYEIGSVSHNNYYPAIVFAPNRFRLYKTYGEMSSWKQFGEWEQNLIQGLDVLPDERKAFFAEYVKNSTTDREKIERVYEYLQKNFRYVSIQLGIGGYKPFPAKFTDEKKYGDCKALSFYMYSVLKSLGIKSHVALINAGYNQLSVDPAFPANQFNHMILCVPQKKDSIWLECTSKTSDFARLGTFTENRHALLITENGGVLVKTPSSSSSANKMNVVTNINLSEDGSGQSSSLITSKGDFREQFSNIIAEKHEDQKEFVVNSLGFKQPDEFSITENKTTSSYQTTIVLEIEKIPEFNAGSKMFLSPRIYQLWGSKLPKTDNRKNDFYFSSVFEHCDTTIYHLPEGYSADVLPKVRESQNDYVAYTTNYWFDKEKNLVYTYVRLTVKKNKVPAAEYASVKKSFDAILSDGAQKIVIKKN